MRKLLSFKWVLNTILVIIGVAVLIRLGFWQLDRLEQRRIFNDRVLSQINRETLNLNNENPFDQLFNMEYRKAVVSGEFDHEQEVLLRNQVWDNRQGYRLLTPMKINGSEYSVLVDRGWIPFEEADQLDQFKEDGEIQIAGVIRRPQTSPDFGGVPDPTLAPGETRLAAWNIVNLVRIQKQVDYPLLPVYIQMVEDPERVFPPYPSAYEPEITEGSHFGYALQWFTFAAILGLGYPFFVRKQLNEKNGLEADDVDYSLQSKIEVGWEK